MIMMCVVAMIISSCAMTHKVRYDMSDIAPAKTKTLEQYVLDIQPIEDIRKDTWANIILWGDSRKIYLEQKQQCVNIEKHYDNGVISTEITQLIAEHIKVKGYFKDVTINRKESADFRVSGKLEQFFGRREFSTTGQTTSMTSFQFGAIGTAIGSLINAAMSAPGEVVIVFKNIEIRDRSGKLISSIDELRFQETKDMRLDGNCWNVYGYVDDGLKIINEYMAGKISSAISAHIAEKSDDDHTKRISN